MPVRNEAKYIERSLGAVLAQDYPADRMEVIVADGMSDDGTRDIIANLKSQAPSSNGNGPTVKVIDNPKKIVAAGLNRAIEESRGEVIVRVDGHTIIEPDYVRQCVVALLRTGADNVGGKMNAVGSGIIGGAIALGTSSPFGVGGARFHYSDDEEWVDTVYLGAWPRRVFDVIGGFDEEMVRNQDDEFNYRLRRRGGGILLVPSIKSIYYCRNSLGALWRQYFQYGFWKVRVMRKHPGQMRMRHFVPGIFVLTVIILAFLSTFFGKVFNLLVSILALYVVSAICFTLMKTGVEKTRSRIALPLVFLVLHVSYGAGFVFGIINLFTRWLSLSKTDRERLAGSLPSV
jgi:glycosyltransferase involved in cell wall biosynthesis